MKEEDHTVLLFSCSVMFNFMQPHGLHAAHQASLPFTISWSLHKLMSIESVMPSNHLILFRSLLLLPSNFSSIRVFSNELVLCIRCPNDWSFSIWYFGHLMWRTDSLEKFEQAPGVDGQGNVACCSLWGHRESDTTEQLNWTDQCFQWIFRVDFLSDWLVCSPCNPRYCQESSSAPQFEGINCSALRLLYSPRFISIHDYWKNNSFECMDFCWQNNVSVF